MMDMNDNSKLIFIGLIISGITLALYLSSRVAGKDPTSTTSTSTTGMTTKTITDGETQTVIELPAGYTSVQAAYQAYTAGKLPY